MKSFVYQITYGKINRSGWRKNKVTVWQIKRNRLHLLFADHEYTFKNEFQAVLEALQAHYPKLLPKQMYERSKSTNIHVIRTPDMAHNMGLAHFDQI